MISGAFFSRLCKNAIYTVQIGVDCGEAVLRRKRETECIHYGLNEKVDTFEDDLKVII